MEIEKKIIGKKMWNILRVVFYMMRKNIRRKSKLMVDLQMLLKKGKMASKAICNLVLRHHQNYYSTLTCRSNDDVNMSFFTPRDYEFSCSNTPTFFTSKRKNSTHNHNHHHHFNTQYSYYQPQELKVMQKVFNILNRNEESISPLFGPSPTGRVTDSPEVDKDAEDFINKFYNELKNQKRIDDALESPSPYHMYMGY